MDHSTLYDLLKSTLPENEISWIIAALRHDAFIWECLQDGSFCRQVAQSGNSSGIWSPANLALTALASNMVGDPSDVKIRTAEQLAADLQVTLDASIRRQSVRYYESLTAAPVKASAGNHSAGSPIDHLMQAGLVALALRERRRLIGSWEGLAGEIKRIQSCSETTGESVSSTSILNPWKTTIACLVGIVPDPVDLLAALANGASTSEFSPLAVHALLCQPVPSEQQISLGEQLLPRLPVAARLHVGRELSIQRPALLSALPAVLFQKEERLSPHPAIPDQAEASDYLHYLEGLLQQNSALLLSGQPEAALPNLHAARESSYRLQAEIAAQIAQNASIRNETDEAIQAWENADQLAPGNPFYQSGLALALIQSGRLEEAAALLPQEWSEDELDPEELHPALRMAAIRYALATGETDIARRQASRLLSQIVQYRSHLPISGPYLHPFKTQELLIDLIRQLPAIFSDLGEYPEASQAARIALSYQPVDNGLLVLLANASYACGEPREAAGAARLAATLEPGRQDYQRSLAIYLEACGEWRQALAARSQVIQLEPSSAPGIEDQRALAYCALEAGEPVKAAEICQQALESEPDDGYAHLYLGRALLDLGNSSEAQAHFEKTTQLMPEHIDAWVALAKLQKEAGQPDQALETLRAASQASPEAPEVYVLLGEAYLDDWEGLSHPAPTQALAVLQHASSLAARQSSSGLGRPKPELLNRIASCLGEAYFLLGHYPEARQQLEPLYRIRPEDITLAYLYAQTLLALRDPAPAIDAFRLVLSSAPDDPGLLYDYANALLISGIEAGEAVVSLNRVLELQPDKVETRGLLAEAIEATGNAQAALQAYQDALETSLVENAAWFIRLTIGLGRSSLAAGHPEIAIASFQEACQAEPQNRQATRLLAEAYQAANLLDDALQSARLALHQAPDDLDTLIWFAENAILWGSSPASSGLASDGSLPSFASQARIDALEAFSHATQIAPQRADLLVRMGRAQILTGDRPAAQETFHKLATMETTSVDDLLQGARVMLDLNDPVCAVACLERALHISEGEAFDASGPDSLAYTLITAYRRAGNPQAALAIVEQACAYSPADPVLYEQKATLLLEINRPMEALAALDTGLDLQTDPAQAYPLHIQAARILQRVGNLTLALAHIEQALPSEETTATPPASSNSHLEAIALGAELTRSLLQDDRALAYLSIKLDEYDEEEDDFQVIEPEEAHLFFRIYCLRAEYDLDGHRPQQAAANLEKAAYYLTHFHNEADSYAPEARLLALRARLMAIQDQVEQSLEWLGDALTKADQPEMKDLLASLKSDPSRPSPAETLHVLASAALELGQWEPALYLYRQAIESAPAEPRGHLDLARTLVLRAEAHVLLQSLLVARHSPGVVALTDYAHESFEKAIQAACTALPFASDHPMITRWRIRGQAVFQPSQMNAQAMSSLPSFPISAEDTAALISVLRRASFNDKELFVNESTPDLLEVSPITLAAQAARSYPGHPAVLIQLALTLATEKNRLTEALRTAQEAVAASQDIIQAGRLADWVPIFYEHHLPILAQAALARIAFHYGDWTTARDAVLAALHAWPDEPRWQTMAADIQMALGDQEAAIAHLEQAAYLEPASLSAILALGEAYLAHSKEDPNQSERAIDVLRKAVELAPEQGEPWIALARAYEQSGDLSRAAECAEQAIRLAPAMQDAILLRAEIALQANEPYEAYERLQTLMDAQNQEGQPAGKIAAAVLLLARTLEKLDKDAEALVLLEQALPSSPEPLPLLLERARLIQKFSGLQTAIDEVHRLVSLYPDEPMVQAVQAKLLAEAGQSDAAIRAAQHALQAVALQSATRGAYLNLDLSEQARLHYLIGNLLRKTGQLDQSLQHLNEAIRLNPYRMENYLELGLVHLERRQLNQALQIYNQATTVAPQDPRPYFQAGLALKESKDYLGAETMLRRAAALAPSDLSIHRQLGAVVALNLVHNRRKNMMDL